MTIPVSPSAKGTPIISIISNPFYYRYARVDECGIPFVITVDFDTLKDNSVTLRDLDTTEQIRMKVN